jgi:hypothetical protein
MRTRLLGFTLVFFVASAAAQSPTPAASPAASAYDLRWAVKIPMRDKVELNATVYLPRTANGVSARTPVIFTLTPYIADNYHARAAYFASHGYAFALVDARGRGNSGGDFEPNANEARDGHDIVEWFGKQAALMRASTSGRPRKSPRRTSPQSCPLLPHIWGSISPSLTTLESRTTRHGLH